MNIQKMILAIGSILIIAAPARADYGAGPSATYGVDVREGSPTTFSLLSTSAIGSWAYAIAYHRYDQVLEFNLSGTITGLALDGSLTGLRHVSAGGDASHPTYASMGMPAGFNLSVSVIPAPPSLDATGLGTTIVGSSDYAGYASVDDGIGPGAAGSAFSITLGAAAVAAANQAISAGDSFYLVLSGTGYAGFDSSLEGDLSPVTLDVQAASQPPLGLTPVPEPSTLVLLVGGVSIVGICGRFRGRSRRGRAAGPPRGTTSRPRSPTPPSTR
ncbi:MAG TPA: PEP-CTERM sorting domain-containing protein [Isosphaeraceae bacterium]